MFHRYVEMLEQQQAQLVAGLQETYRRLCAATAWPGAPLVEHSGHPLTHDILARLELLEPKHDGSGEMEVFEEDCKNLQNRLLSDGAPFVRRRGSFSSDSDHSHTQRHARHSSYSSARETPVPSKAQPIFEENWCFQPASPESSSQSPAPKSGSSRHSVKPSPLGTEAFKRDDYLPSHWSDVEPAADVFMRSQFAIQVPALHDGYQPLMDSYVQAMDLADLDNGNLAYSPHFSTQAQTSSMYGLQEWTNEPMDVDFSKFVQVST